MAGLKAVFSSGWSSELPSLPVQDTIQAPGPASLFWVPNLVKLSTKFPDSTGYCPDFADGRGRQLGSPKCHCNQNYKVGNSFPGTLVRLPAQVRLAAVFNIGQGYKFDSLPRWGCRTGSRLARLFVWGPNQAELCTKLPG